MSGEAGKQRIALVGHCGPDSYAIRGAVQAMVPGAEVRFVNDGAAAEQAAAAGDVLLVNRVLDGDFETSSGLELIRALAPRGARVMLVSNYAEAQAEAEAAGALPGFGKAGLYSAAMRERLAAAVR